MQWALQVPKGQQGHKAFKVLPGHRVQPDLQVVQAHKVQWDLPELMVQQAHRVQLGHKEYKE